MVGRDNGGRGFANFGGLLGRTGTVCDWNGEPNGPNWEEADELAAAAVVDDELELPLLEEADDDDEGEEGVEDFAGRSEVRFLEECLLLLLCCPCPVPL